MIKETKLISILTYVENFLGLYRNYVLMSKTKKCLIMLRITIDIFCLMWVLLQNAYTMYKVLSGVENNFYPKFFYLFGTMKSITEIILSIKFSKQFQTFFKHINKVHCMYTDCELYQKDSKHLLMFVIFNICFQSFTRVTIFIIHLIQAVLHFKGYGNNIYSVLLNFYEIWIHGRHSFQYLMLFSLTMVIHNLLKCLNKSASDFLREAEKITRRISEANNAQLLLNELEIMKWSTIYDNFVVCSKLLNLFFSKQVIYFTFTFFC